MRPPEEVIRDLVQQWLAKAEEDYGVAEHLVSENTPYLGVVGFHAQQAAEKYLKALLVRHQIEFPKTHNLGELLELLQIKEPAISASLHSITALNPYGVNVRYPGDVPHLTPDEAKTAVSLATQVREAVLSALSAYLGENL